jgi:hypothetical protein
VMLQMDMASLRHFLSSHCRIRPLQLNESDYACPNLRHRL